MHSKFIMCLYTRKKGGGGGVDDDSGMRSGAWLPDQY